MTKKRFVIISLLIALPSLTLAVQIGITAYYNHSASQGAEVLGTRATEFFAAQRALPDTKWKHTQTTAPVPIPTGRSGDPSCLTFMLNTATRDQKVEQTDRGCVIRLTTMMPLGHLVITFTAKNTTPLREESGIRLRMAHPDRFPQRVYDPPPPFEEAAQYESRDGLVTFLRQGDQTIYIAFSEYATASAQLHVWHTQIIETLEISPSL